MTEKKVLELIKASAEQETIPQSVAPEQIKKDLKKKRYSGSGKRLFGKRAAAAAVVLALGGIVGMQAFHQSTVLENQSLETASKEETDISAEIPEMSADSITEITSNSEEKGTDLREKTEKGDIGSFYIPAKDYGEVYDCLEVQAKELQKPASAYTEDMPIDEGYTVSVQEDGAMTGAAEAFPMEEVAVESSMMYASSENQTNSSDTKISYSKTNVQTEGVDESDIVKTDGSYIYTVSRGRLVITDIRDGILKEIGRIDIVSEQTADNILEMYVDGTVLNLIVERENTGLSKESSADAAEEVYSLTSDVQTQILTYDISNPKQPRQTGTMTQDGYYRTSRKIGTKIYLFTDKSMSYPSEAREQALQEENLSGWIPLVNGKTVEADRIYLSNFALQGLVIAAIDVHQPNAIVDNTVIMNGYVDIYVSNRALYLYQTDYDGSNITTQIAKFSLSNGSINAVNAASVKGEIRDTFAINETDGYLRVLTTENVFTDESSNGLYLFDEQMNAVGQLENIAKGEEIYAARYFGEMAYFVTYRNTDPLFAVDLSDVSNPKLVGELKITGFSEYLHFWGEDKLVGIGYETDPSTGERRGLKLTMFDISNPAEIKELNSVVLKNADYSQALYNYKCVLADAGENMIGFSTEEYSLSHLNYLLFAWENGKFVNLLTEKMADNFSSDEYRGVYADKWFYIVNRDGIRAYDREEGYKLCGEIKF